MRIIIKNFLEFIKHEWVFCLFFSITYLIYFFELNQKLFLVLHFTNFHIPKVISTVVDFISYAKHFILSVILFTIVLIFKNDKLKNVILLIALFYILFSILKITHDELRPYAFYSYNLTTFISNCEDAIITYNKSFPSGHIGNMTIFVFSLIQLFFYNNRIIKCMLYALLILTSIVLVSTGCNWPLDILISYLFAYILVKICFSIKFDYFS